MTTGNQMAGSGVTARLNRWLFPEPPAAIVSELRRLQFDRLRSQMPFLHGVGTFSMLLIIWLAVYDGAPWWLVAGLCTLPVLSVIRILTWSRENRVGRSDEQLADFLQSAHWVSAIGLLIASTIAAVCYLADVSSQPIVVPLSLAFGTMCIAFSFAPYPAMAMTALLVGMVPSSVVLLLTGDVLAQMVAVSSLSVAFLLVRFIREHYRQIVESLVLGEQVRKQAVTDPLTGLLNRRGFDEALNAGVAQAQRQSASFTMILADLDDFKLVNDAYGHTVGDAFLKTLADRLFEAVETMGTASRIGGDEFAVLCPDLPEAQAASFAETLLATVCRPVQVAGVEVAASMSMGTASLSPLVGTPPKLLKAADDALYRAKRGGKERVAHHDGRVMTRVGSPDTPLN
ncbi:MAG: diguanylate cyclase [Pacificimonas sp.]|jgi:diguanylate cyclase (GGDEF)-like protein|nr:diguanylate cyclase [Pacificimonas sp.]